MLESLKGFTLELTNICTLKCPRCARTDFINKFPSSWKNKNINFEHLKTFLDIPLQQKVFDLCGNYGDPIYYNDLFDLLIWLKSHGAIIIITTNGSYKTTQWWKELGSILNFDDKVVFAIDGLPNNFTNYRINADWSSIENGIKTISNYTSTVWKYIPFRYNEENIEEAKKLSIELGMSLFYVDPSSRWESPDDPLKPSLIDPLYANKIIWTTQAQPVLDPLCKKTNNEHFISADGYYTPCCFVADHRFYYSSEFYKNKDRYSIETNTISQVLQNLSSYYKKLENSNYKYCTFNCAKI